MIGKDIYEVVFRDTKNFYNEVPSDIVSRPIIRFIKKYSGKKVLDFGCAVGNYSLYLSKNGYDVSGVDINEQYVELAKKRGVNAYHSTGKAPFDDKSFDTVIILEVLEHLEDHANILDEAKRLARKNILITTPNCTNILSLRNEGLLFEHFADKDHRNFFTKSSLQKLLEVHFSEVKVFEGNPINPFGLFRFKLIRLLGKVLAYSKILPAQYNYRLFAVAHP